MILEPYFYLIAIVSVFLHGMGKGGFIGAGVDFKMVGQTSVSTMFGLELLKLNEVADSNIDYSGFLIHLSFNRRLK